MTRRTVDRLLATLVLASVCGAGLWTWAWTRQLDRLDRDRLETAEQLDRLDALLEEVAAVERIATDSGHPGRPILDRVSDSLREIDVGVTALEPRMHALRAEPASAVTEATAALRETSARALVNMDAGFDLMAADLLLAGTRDARLLLGRGLLETRTTHADLVVAAQDARLRWIWAAWAAVTLLGAWGIVRWSRLPTTRTVEPPPNEPVRPQVDLEATARLCTALGRLETEAELPAHLETLARILGASGVIVWIGAGRELLAVAAHGYDTALLARLSPVDADAPHAIAEAWRTACVQTVAGDSTSKAAVAAPIQGPGQCVGVLAIECPGGRESDQATLVVATLVAAQLAGLLSGVQAAGTAPAAGPSVDDATDPG